MPRYQLAQLNIATLLAPLNSPQLSDFVDNLDRINALAESSDGFVWRFDESYDLGDDVPPNSHPAAVTSHPFGPDVVVNLSVWRDVASLQAFAFKTGHVEILRRKREWFARMDEAYMVLWWVPEGHEPTVDEAAERLAHLRTHGPTAHAFGFRDTCGPPDNAAEATTPAIDQGR